MSILWGRVACSTLLYRLDTFQRSLLSHTASRNFRVSILNSHNQQNFHQQHKQGFRSVMNISLRNSINVSICGLLQHVRYDLLIQRCSQNQPTLTIKRNMGGGPRNEEHKERLRAIRKARKIYFESLPERPPKPSVCTKHFNEVTKWKNEPISKTVEHRVIHICSFIIYAWLNAYPNGASLRKLQRDIAFRMQRKHRLPGKLPYDVIMPIVGKLERENYLSVRMKSNGHVLIYRDKAVNIVPDGQTGMHALSKKADEEDEDDDDDDDDDDRFNIPLAPGEIEGGDNEEREDPTTLSKPISEEEREALYEKLNYRPKFFKEQKPKEKKVKRKKIRDKSDPVMDEIEIPPGTQPTTRGPRFIMNSTSQVENSE
jgi:hypothetical protein